MSDLIFPKFRGVEPNAADLATLCLFVRQHNLLRAGSDVVIVGAAGWREHLRMAFPDATTLPKGPGSNRARLNLIREADAAACKALGLKRSQHAAPAATPDPAPAATPDPAPAATPDPAPAAGDVAAAIAGLTPAQVKRLPLAVRQAAGVA